MNIKSMFLGITALLSASFAQYSVQLPINTITVKNLNGTAVFSGAALSNKPGEPQLPRYTVSMLLPPEADFKSVKAAIQNLTFETLDDEFEVEPTPPFSTSPRQGVYPKNKVIREGKDIAVYESDAFFPNQFLGGISFGKLRQYKIAEIEVFPVRYNPASKKIQILTGGSLTVTVPGASVKPATNNRSTNRALSPAEKLLKNKVKNFETVSEYEPQSSINAKSSAVSGERFVIITTQSIVDNSSQLSNFISAKKDKGFTVQVVTENQWGGGTGDVAADRIRTWLSNNYISLNITNVLLIGDPDPVSGDVPMKMCHPRSWDVTDDVAPTDFYYAELSGNWDADNDGLFGEFDDSQITGGPDKMAELIVGRIPVYGSINNLDKILAKTVAYDSDHEKSWRRNVLLPMEPSDVSTSGMALAQQIKSNILVPNSFNFYRLGDTLYSDGKTRFTDVIDQNPPVEKIPCSIDNVLTTWETNPYGLVVWWTHGWSQGASDIFTSNNAQYLDDSKSSFTFQVSCTNGMPEDVSNLGYKLLENGAIGTVSATRVSWYFPGQTDFTNTPTNSGMAYQYSRYMVAEKMSAGEALLNVKWNMDIGGDGWWMNCIGFNLYGSPDMSLDVPSVTYLSDLPIVSSSNGYGPVEKDMANGESAANDGDSLKLGDMVFSKGLGTHAYSEVIYNLDGKYSLFSSWIGIDRYAGDNGTVDFQVFADGNTVFSSGFQSGQTAPRRITLDVSNVNQLRLVVNDYDGSISHDHADWADAYLSNGSTQPDNMSIQAENTQYCSWSSGVVESKNGGFSGSGYVNVSNKTEEWIECRVNVANAGVYQMDVNYANGGSARGATLEVNGINVATGSFASTHSWTEWINETFTNLSLNAGSNTIRLTATTSGGLANIDRFEFTGENVTPTYYSLTLTTVGDGSIQTSPSGNSFAKGTVVTCTAVASSGFRFFGWSGDLSGNQTTATITMDSDKDVYATFIAVPQFQLHTSAYGSGSVLRNPDKPQYDSNEVVILTAVPNAGHSFEGWVGDHTGMNNPDTIVMDGNKLIEATFSEMAKYKLHVDAYGPGSVYRNPDKTEYDANEVVVIRAIPNNGSYFAGWVGDHTGMINPDTIIMDGSKSIEAIFADIPQIPQYTLNTTVYGLGSVSRNPDKIQYDSNEVVTLTAIPEAGSNFTGWVGDYSGYNNPISVVMDGNKLIEATFTSNPPTCSLSIQIFGMGECIINPNKTVFEKNEVVTITAQPHDGYMFFGWSGDLSGSSNPATIIMDSNKAIYPTFILISQPISIEAENTTYCSWSSGGVETKNKGYSGTSYINVDNRVGEWIQCNVDIPTAGIYQLKIRYANGSSARGATVKVNGGNSATGNFPGTGSWTTWNNEIISNISLNAGSNTVRLTATTSGGLVNIDLFDFSK